MWVFVVCFISLSVGGILNAIRYIINEGWWLRDDERASIDVDMADANSNRDVFGEFRLM